MLAYLDGDFLMNISRFIREGGQMLPDGPNANWTLDPSVAKLRM